MDTSHQVDKSFRILRPLQPQAALYLALGATLILFFVGIVTTTWLWQVKDWGLSADARGRILTIDPGSAADLAGVTTKDTISFEDFRNLKKLAGEVNTGHIFMLNVQSGSESRILELVARDSDLSRRIGLCVITWVGMGFVLVGAAPLIARRRNFILWMFFICSQLTGLFLIVEVPRSLHVIWAEFASYSVLPFFPAALFHFHTLFPQPKLGLWRRKAVSFCYVLAFCLLPLALLSLWDHAFFYSRFWQSTTEIYMVGALLICLVLLAHTYLTTNDRLIKSQLKVITLCSGVGLAVNATLLAVNSWFNRDTAILLENLAVISALATPLGYAYSILRYNLLINGLLWRRWLGKATVSSLTVLIGAILAVGLASSGGANGGTVVVTWALIIFVAIVLGVLSAVLSSWTENRMVNRAGYVALLNGSSEQLRTLSSVDKYVDYFTNTLPTHLKSKGAILFLAETSRDSLVTRAATDGWQAPERDALALSAINATGELGKTLFSLAKPVPLAALLMPSAPQFPTEDQKLLELMRASDIEYLLPLISAHQSKLSGLVALGSKETDENYSTQELATLSAVLQVASASAENVLLFEIQQKQLSDLADLAHRVSTTQDETRKEIARNLHDTTLQKLSVIHSSLTAMREDIWEMLTECEQLALTESPVHDPTAQSQIDRVLDDVQLRLGILLGEDTNLLTTEQSHRIRQGRPRRRDVEWLIGQVQLADEQLRAICNNLHPPYLEDPLLFTLEQSIKWFRTLTSTAAINLTVEGVEPTDVGDEIKNACKEVLEQAVQNAIDHASATHVNASLQFVSDGSILLRIIDDGFGFDPLHLDAVRHSGHHGLRNMHDRAYMTGGTLRIDSCQGCGTTVTLHIPAKPQEPTINLSSAPASSQNTLNEFSTATALRLGQ